MDRRAFLCGLLGWVVPGIVAVPLMGTKESAGGEAALGILFAWWALGVVGCFIGGVGATVRGRSTGTLTPALTSGLAGVAVSWVVAIAVEVVVTATVSVLHLGGLSVLMPIPFVIAYGVGFGIAAILSRPVSPG